MRHGLPAMHGNKHDLLMPISFDAAAWPQEAHHLKRTQVANAWRFFIVEDEEEFCRIGAWKAPSFCAESDGAVGSMNAVTTSPKQLAVGITRAGMDLGLTEAQAACVSSLYLICDVRKAATSVGISYHTAREHLKTARAKLGYENSLLMLSDLIIAASGGRGDQAENDDFLMELFDLTERQMALAQEIAMGETREFAAEKLGISVALAKKELTWVFASTGVSNALQLVRLFGEARALAMLLAEPLATNLPRRLPLTARDKILQRTDGRKIGMTDYGPEGALPVLVLHSSMTSRFVNRTLIKALQDAGFRPIALDRPGFGDTDLMAKVVDPFEAGAQDMLWFCDSHGIERIRVVTRGAAQVVLALHRLAADRIEAVVLVNPDPDLITSTRSDGIMGAMRLAFTRRPFAIRAMTRVISTISNPVRRRRNLLRFARLCPPDHAIMQDEDNVEDYLRAMASVADGTYEGFINEQVAFATQVKPDPISGTSSWYALIGAEDFMHHPHEVMAYWRDVLPDGHIRQISGAGRFLAYSHVSEVVGALLET